MLTSFKKTDDVKPGKLSIQVARINLFRNMNSVLQGLKTPGIPQKVLTNIKKDIIKHIRSYPADKMIEKITHFDAPDLIQITRTIYESANEVDVASLIKQLLEKQQKKSVKENLKISVNDKKRLALNIFFDENPTWREKALSQLIEILYKHKKKTELSEDDEILLVGLFSILDKSPPLPIPTPMLHKFLLESDFVPNTDQDERVFAKKNGLYLLKQQIEDGKTLKEITPLLNIISERNRKYYRVKFFNLTQVKSIVEAYEKNPFKLDVILQEYVTVRDIKLLDSKGNIIPLPVKTTGPKKFSHTTKGLSFSGKPFLYMIIRPWIPNLKEIHISTAHKPYVNQLLYIDKDDESWFSPSSDFYSDCTKTSTQKENILYLRDGNHQVKVKFILYSGKHFLQNESIFKKEEEYFMSNARYTLSFLDRAAKVISISLLNNEYMCILKNMGQQIISSALSKVLDSKRYNLDTMSTEILGPILTNSVFIRDYFSHLFDVVKRFDSSVCLIAQYHHIYHDRIKKFFYKLDSLYKLPDKYSWFEKKYLKDYDDVITKSKDYFINKNLYDFRAKLFPFERISDKIYVPILKFEVPYPTDKITKDSLYEIQSVDLRIVAAIVMNDASSEAPENIEELQTFFDFDYVYYMDNIEIFTGYPLYFITEEDKLVVPDEPDQIEKEEETGHDFEHLWEQFEERIKDLEDQPKNEYPLFVAGTEQEGPVNLFDEDGEEADVHDDDEEEDNDFYDGFPDLHEEDED